MPASAFQKLALKGRQGAEGHQVARGMVQNLCRQRFWSTDAGGFRLAMIKAEQQFVAELARRIENGWGPRDLWQSIHDDREGTVSKLHRQFGGSPMA